MSSVSPAARLGRRGAKVRSDHSMRIEREAARTERLADTAKKRRNGDLPPIVSKKKKGGKGKKPA